MGQITRTWLGFAAIGAGFIHLALVVGSPPPIAVPLLLLGLAEFGWGVLTFARDELLAPSMARIVAIVPIVMWSLLVVVATLLPAPEIVVPLTFLPMAAATVFEVFVAGILSVHLRRGAASAFAGEEPDAAARVVAPATPPAGRYLLALGVGALVMAGLTTPALAATEAGRFAQAHGEHSADFVPEPEDTDPLSGLLVPGHDDGH